MGISLVVAAFGLGGCTGDDDGGADGDGSTTAATGSTGGSATDGPGSTGGGDTTSGATATGSSDGADSSTGTEGCGLEPLSDDEIANLVLWSGFDNAVPVGGTLQLSLGLSAAGPPQPIEACVAWSVSPSDDASVDDDGLLALDATAEAGTVYTVTADVESGRAVLTHDVTAYVPVQAPIVGWWTEASQIPCMGPRIR